MALHLVKNVPAAESLSGASCSGTDFFRQWSVLPEFGVFQDALDSVKQARAVLGPVYLTAPLWDLPRGTSAEIRNQLRELHERAGQAEIKFFRAWTEQCCGEHFRGAYCLACLDPINFLVEWPGGQPTKKLGHWDYVDIGYNRDPSLGSDPQRQRLKDLGFANPEILPDFHFGGDAGWQDFAFAEQQARVAAGLVHSIRLVPHGIRPHFSADDLAALPRELTERHYDLILFNYLQGRGEWSFCRSLLKEGGFLITQMTPEMGGREEPDFRPELLFRPLLLASPDSRFSLLQKL